LWPTYSLAQDGRLTLLTAKAAAIPADQPEPPAETERTAAAG
jgi:hypothetical protein